MKHVFFNGVRVLKNGEHTGARPGTRTLGSREGQVKCPDSQSTSRSSGRRIKTTPDLRGILDSRLGSWVCVVRELFAHEVDVLPKHIDLVREGAGHLESDD